MANKHMKRCSTPLIVQFSSVTQSCPTLGDPMNRSRPGLPVHHQLPVLVLKCLVGLHRTIQLQLLQCYWLGHRLGCSECSNYRTIALISHASKVMLKMLQARLQQYMNHELQMFKLVLEKAEEPEIKLPKHPLDHGKSKRVPEKHLFLLY